jgi:hypothetical protein
MVLGYMRRDGADDIRVKVITWHGPRSGLELKKHFLTL